MEICKLTAKDMVEGEALSAPVTGSAQLAHLQQGTISRNALSLDVTLYVFEGSV